MNVLLVWTSIERDSLQDIHFKFRIYPGSGHPKVFNEQTRPPKVGRDWGRESGSIIMYCPQQSFYNQCVKSWNEITLKYL